MEKRKILKTLLWSFLLCFLWLGCAPDGFAAENDNIQDKFDIGYIENYCGIGSKRVNAIEFTYNRKPRQYNSYDEAVQDLGVICRKICKKRYENEQACVINIPIKFKSEEIPDFETTKGESMWKDVYAVIKQHTDDPDEGDMLSEENARSYFNSIQSIKYENGVYSVNFRFNVTREHTSEEYKAFQAKAKAVLEEIGINDNKSDIQKLYAIFEWEKNNVKYQYTGKYIIQDDGTSVCISDDQSAYSALIEGGAVCAGYSHLYKYLALSAGIRTYYITGWSIDSSRLYDLVDSGKYNEETKSFDMSGVSTNHAWNLVKINDTAYFIDATHEKFLFGKFGKKSSLYYKGKIYPIYLMKDCDNIPYEQIENLNLSDEDYSLDILDCTHETKELRNEKPASLKEDGYTGDTYCTVCERVIDKGKIIPKEDFDVTLSSDTFVYTGKEIKPEPVVSYHGQLLSKDTDYLVSYEDNIKKGYATITIQGLGEYAGSTQKEFQILTSEITDDMVVLNPDKEYVYTGKAIPADFSIAGLEEGTDYSVAYENNINAGTASVTVTGIDNYVGTVTKTYTIKRRKFVTEDITLDAASYEYTGSGIKPVVSIAGYTEGTHFTVSYKNNLNAGEGIVTVEGMENCEGTVEKTFTITPKDLAVLSEAKLFFITYSPTSVTYNGEAQTISLTMKDSYAQKTLEEGVDYTLSFKDNVNAGLASVTVHGMGNYANQFTKTYRIKAQSISDMTLNYNAKMEYTGEEICPKVTIEGLEEGTDFDVAYENNIKLGARATITVTAKGNYTGTKTAYFRIVSGTLEGRSIVLSKNTYEYTGKEICPQITIEGLQEGTDYTVSYTNNIHAGTAVVSATGKGKYEGTITADFTITPKDIKDEAVVFDSDTYECTGKEICPEVSIEGLQKETDFIVTYENNINIGEGKVIVTGTGDWKGSIEKTFSIVEKITDIRDFTVTGASGSYTYCNTAICPEVTVTDPETGTVLEKGTDYSVEYQDNINVGTAAIVITGKSLYKGSITKNFIISPANIKGKEIKLEKKEFTFTGSKINPAVTVEGLSASDYKVSYTNNIHAGTGNIIVNGTGNYTGTLTDTFTILPKTLTEADIVLDSNTFDYTGEEFCPEVTLAVPGADYELTNVVYKNNKEIGAASVTVTCTGDYEGTAVKQFIIRPMDIGYAIMGYSVDSNGYACMGNNYYYTGKEIKPYFELDGLEEGTDYVITYKNNIQVGTAEIMASGIGKYCGTYSYYFKIIKSPSSSTPAKPAVVKVSSIKITGISKQIAAGKKIKLTASVLPAKAANKKIRWTSSNPKVATVTQTGVVTMKKNTGGKTVIITASSTDGSGKKAVYKIKSMKGVVKKLSVSGAKTIKRGKTLKLKAKVTATKGANKKLKWVSSNPKNATVSASGKVKAKKAGKIKITVMATDGSGKKKTVTIKIK